MHEQDLALNNLQRLICCKNQPTNQPIKVLEKKQEEQEIRGRIETIQTIAL